MIERMPISRMGFKRLREELEHLSRRERHDVIFPQQHFPLYRLQYCYHHWYFECP